MRPSTLGGVSVCSSVSCPNAGRTARESRANRAGIDSPPVQDPRIRTQVVDGPQDGFFDAQPWLPASSAHSRAIQKDERAVANPTARAARIGETRLKPQML